MGARMSYLIFECSILSATNGVATSGKSNGTREDKFHISNHPCIILFIS